MLRGNQLRISAALETRSTTPGSSYSDGFWRSEDIEVENTDMAERNKIKKNFIE